MDHDDLEGLLLGLIKLLAASHFLDQLLHDDSIIVVCFARRHFQVVHRGENDAAAGRARRRANLVLLLLTSNLMHGV